MIGRKGLCPRRQCRNEAGGKSSPGAGTVGQSPPWAGRVTTSNCVSSCKSLTLSSLSLLVRTMQMQLDSPGDPCWP